MTRKKKIISYVLTIVVLVGGFLALRIPSWTRTFGLPREVIQGEENAHSRGDDSALFLLPQST